MWKGGSRGYLGKHQTLQCLEEVGGHVWRPVDTHPSLALSLGLILGGALGNLWDRVELGYVVDFVSVHYQGRYFPAFNIADSAISVGAGLMLLDSFIGGKREQEC